MPMELEKWEIIVCGDVMWLYIKVAKNKKGKKLLNENDAGLSLADRLGFARVGVLHEVGHKFGRPLDVVICESLV